MESKEEFAIIKRPKESKPTTLESLPTDILLGILFHVANTSLTDIRSVELTSKKWGKLANDKFVWRNLPLHQVDLFPNFHHQYGKRFYNFMKRCRVNENPEAIYRKWLINYFHPTSEERQWLKGLNQMAKAAEYGNEEAKYIYGLVLLCLGGDNINKSLNILSLLLTGSWLSILLQKFKNLREKNIAGLSWWASERLKLLKSTYCKRKCNCGGKTQFENHGWYRNGLDNDIMVSLACHICVWDYEVQQLTRYL